MLTGDTAELRKARGAYFTPSAVARFISAWAIRSANDAVLEPSCGEAVFLHEAGRDGRHKGALVGVELHDSSAAQAEQTLRAEGIDADIHVGDFFHHSQFGVYDAVIGNPPYVRYQDFSGESRVRARQAAFRAGVSLTNLASSWAAFTVHSALHLRAGGRLGLVLPAELLTVNYAAGVRQFLMDHFNDVGLVLFEERVFPGVLEEVVLLLADGYDPRGIAGTDHMTMWQVRDAAGLIDLAESRRWTPPSKSAKWSAGLMSASGLAAYDHALTGQGFTVLETWGDTTLGMVTGNNNFFTLAPAKARELRLQPTDLLRLSPPGSRHLRALTLTDAALDALGDAGQASLLFRPADEPSKAAWRYIKSGELLDVHQAYKCRVRSPWWRVPYLRPADLFLTYMNADTPRLASNRARAHHLNSVHGVYLRDDLRTDGLSLLPLASLNSVTLLGAETVGRAYGGGMLKIEPREADLLPVPSPAHVRAHRDALNRVRPTAVAHVRAGRLLEAVALVDDVLLTRGLGMAAAHLAAIRNDHADLTARRVARGKDSARGV
ncbi:N-6 DNA methylase [Nakamurella endophytica]|uniref:Methyltransferase n=1 Tax=Nakamurella endophytica TaxID=1748367 RepID=A0A917T3Q0_9ACTN|nr:methyltransferase [Nakamurella endophytica]